MLQHYKGGIGEFDYDDKQFELRDGRQCLERYVDSCIRSGSIRNITPHSRAFYKSAFAEEAARLGDYKDGYDYDDYDYGIDGEELNDADYRTDYTVEERAEAFRYYLETDDTSKMDKIDIMDTYSDKIQDEYLVYVGSETDASAIDIPEGLTDYGFLFSEKDLDYPYVFPDDADYVHYPLGLEAMYSDDDVKDPVFMQIASYNALNKGHDFFKDIPRDKGPVEVDCYLQNVSSSYDFSSDTGSHFGKLAPDTVDCISVDKAAELYREKERHNRDSADIGPLRTVSKGSFVRQSSSESDIGPLRTVSKGNFARKVTSGYDFDVDTGDYDYDYDDDWVDYAVN